MVTWSTRYATKRITDGINGAIKVLESSRQEYEEAAEEVADWWGSRIRSSGRGSQWNPQMSNIQSQVTTPKRGGYFIRVGWLSGAPMAKDGRTSWFVYQDTGYHMFGGERWIPGLMLQLDARQRLEVEIFKANERIARKAEREIGRIR